MGKRHFFGRYAVWIILASIACAPMLFSYAGKAVKHNANRVEDWLPGRYIETKQLSWFRQQFVADQFVVVSWDGCRLGGDPSDPDAEPDDPRIAELAAALVQNSKPTSTTPVPEPSLAPQSADTSAPDPTRRDYFKKVTTAREVLDQLTSPPTSLSYEEAIERLKGSLVGPDGRQTCLVVAISETGAKHLRDAIGRGFQGKRLIQRQPGELFKRAASVGLAPEQIHLGGPPVDNVAIDEEGEKTLLRLSSLAGLLGLGLCWSSLRSVRLTVIVFLCALLSGAAGLAVVALTGQSTDAVLMSMPALVYVLSISASVHLINHYREALVDPGPAGAVERAIGHGWKPAFLCTLTTALGLFSLCTSELTPIRKFGFYSAVGVFAMLAVSFLVLPAALEIWHRRKVERDLKRTANTPKSQRKAAALPEVDRLSDLPTRFEAFWQWLGGGIIRRHALVTFGCMAFIVAMSFGVTRLKTSIDLLKLFDPHARILQDYAWLEKNLGRLVPMELVLRFPAATTITAEAQSQAGAQAAEYAGRLSFLDRLETASLVEQSIKKMFGEQGEDIVGQTVSAATFAPADPGQQSGPRVMRFARRSAASQQLEQSRGAFESTGFLGLDPADHAELWRVSVRVAAFQNVDYGQFVRELRDGVEPIMAALDTRTEVLHRIAQHREDGSYAGANVWVLAPKVSEQKNLEKADVQLPWISSKLSSFSPWRPDDTKEKTEYAEIVYSTYRAALNQFLRRSNLSVQWKEVTSDNLEAVMREAADKADCVVWTSTKNSVPISMPASFSGDTTQSAIVHVNGMSDLQHRMTPLEDRLAMAAALETSSEAKEDGPSHSSAIGIDAQVLGGQTSPEAIYTGVVPIVYKAQRELLNSLIESTIWSFATITPLMMFVSRGVRAGTVVMIPNTLPVLVVFGGMGWLGAAVDIGSMMSASIALGVAVDDTIHFLTWFREELAKGTSRREALLLTYRRCASPTLQAAMISGLGLSIFAMSTFTPTQRFGWLMLTILLAGVVAELIMLPALLAGPLGNIFEDSVARNPRRLTSRIVRTFLGSTQRADKATQDTGVGRYHFGVKAFLRFLSR